MSFGLQVFRQNSDMVVGEDTYTVRLVDTIYCQYGVMGVGQSIYISNPQAKTGMFAMVSPLFQWSKRVGIGLRMGSQNNKSPSTPACEVLDGSLRLFASAVSGSNSDAHTSGNVVIYLFNNR